MAYVIDGTKEDYSLVQSRIDEFYPDLVECQMTFGILMAHPSPDNPERPPLMSRGFPVTGDITKSNAKQRIHGAKDVTVVFDGPHWSGLDDDARAAEADHWLHRLMLQRDKKTKVYKTDDAHRPVFKMRPHDKEVGVYDEIVRRHGRNAPESRAVEELSLHYNTLLPPKGNAVYGRQSAVEVEEGDDLAAEFLGLPGPSSDAGEPADA